MSTFDEAMSLKLKPEQLQVIRHVYDRKDAFLWLPKGFGKSVCYETLPFVFDHKERSSTSCSSTNCSAVLVVSPLVSLMIDQVESRRKRCVQGSHLSLDLS